MISEIEKGLLNISVSSKNTSCSVPKIDSKKLSYSDFFANYLLPNKPCVLLNISNNWPCFKNWIQNNKPNLIYLNKYTDFEITVSNCDKRKYNAHSTENMSFGSYINYWKKYTNKEKSNLLYLKDWHLKNKTDENFYTVPYFFSSDWLNEYFMEKTIDDYRFVYMGPAGTWTPFHADVFTSFSWSVNICGQKKWLLFPPGEENFLRDNLGNLPFDVTKLEYKRNVYEIIQNPDEAIFVPSGWYHQVWNLKDTISVNHNWVNGCNIINMWQTLIENLDKVKKEISDCKDMDKWLDHCQLMLKTSYGLDFPMFYDFVLHIATKRIKMLQSDLEIKQFDTWILGKNHAIFDLLKIRDVLTFFMNHLDYNFIDFNGKLLPNNLLSNINTVLVNIKS